jgi:hypothetical protein
MEKDAASEIREYCRERVGGAVGSGGSSPFSNTN